MNHRFQAQTQAGSGSTASGARCIARFGDPDRRVRLGDADDPGEGAPRREA